MFHMEKIDNSDNARSDDVGEESTISTEEASKFLSETTPQSEHRISDTELSTIKHVFLPPEDTSTNPYEAYKMVEEIPNEDEKLEEFAGSSTVDGSKTRCQKCRNYNGILCTLGAGFVFTIGGIIVKYMKHFHPVTLTLYRFQGVFLPGLALALYYEFVKKEPVFSTVWPWTDMEKLKKVAFMSFRGVLGGIALIFLVAAIQYMTLADALVIHSCRPVVVTLIAYIFIGEPCGIFPVFAALLTIVGVGVIARPPLLTGAEGFDSDTLIGIAYGLGGMLTTAVSMVVLRHIRGVHVSLVTFAFGLWGTIVSALGCLVFGRFDIPQTTVEWLLVLVLAGVTFIAQVGMTLAMKYEQAGAVAVLRSADTVHAFLLQFLILGTVPDLYSLLGATLIISCVLMITFRKWVSTRPEKHSARRRYWFVLK